MFEDLKFVYRRAGKGAVDTMKSQPLSIFLPVALQLLFFAMALVNRQLVASLNVLGGFIVAIVNAAGLSIAYTQYRSLIENGRFNSASIIDQMKYYFFPIYSIYFIFMLIRIFTFRSGIISLILFFVINPLPEVLYLGRRHGMDAISSSFEFIRDNAIHWLLPLAVMLLVINIFTGTQSMINALYMTDIIDQVKGLTSLRSLSFNLGNMVLIIISGFYNLFRGHLYKILAGSSVRKRKFMGEMNL